MRDRLSHSGGINKLPFFLTLLLNHGITASVAMLSVLHLLRDLPGALPLGTLSLTIQDDILLMNSSNKEDFF